MLFLTALLSMAPQKMAAYTRGKHPLIGFIHITANILAYEREIAEDILGSLFLDGWSGVAQQVIELLNKTFVNVTKKVREGGSIYGLLMMLDVDNELNETLPQITNAIKMSNDGRNPLGIDLTNSKGKVDSELGKWIGEFETILTGETAAPLSVALKVLEVQQEKSSHKPSFIPPDGTVHELVASVHTTDTDAQLLRYLNTPFFYRE